MEKAVLGRFKGCHPLRSCVWTYRSLRLKPSIGVLILLASPNVLLAVLKDVAIGRVVMTPGHLRPNSLPRTRSPATPSILHVGRLHIGISMHDYACSFQYTQSPLSLVCHGPLSLYIVLYLDTAFARTWVSTSAIRRTMSSFTSASFTKGQVDLDWMWRRAAGSGIRLSRKANLRRNCSSYWPLKALEKAPKPLKHLPPQLFQPLSDPPKTQKLPLPTPRGSLLSHFSCQAFRSTAQRAT